MAFYDGLFQLGMSLTSEIEIAKKDYFIRENNQVYAAKHYIIDLYNASDLDDINLINSTLKKCVEVSGATLININLHYFEPNGGVCGVAVLAESHISIHTWPEKNYASLDVFMCGQTKPELCIDVLKNAFKTENIEFELIKRGMINE